MAHFDSKNNPTPLNLASPASPSSSEPQPTADIDNKSRRRFLRMAMGTAAAGLVTSAGMETVLPSPAMAQPIADVKITPWMALHELVEGNKRYVAGNLTSFDVDLAIIRHHTSEKQQPFAAVLACSDSRVPVEIVFDQTIGRIFVARDAGNVITPEIIGSLEYGVAVLGAKAILVMGHTHCGAVEATIAGTRAPGQISSLYPHIQPAVDQSGPDEYAVVQTNARIQADLLRKASTVIAQLVNEKRLLVVAAVYNIASGVVTLLE